MKSAFVAALGAAVLVSLGASSAAQAGTINFGFGAFDGSISHTGDSLDASDSLDIDQAILAVMEVGPGDMSGLAPLKPPITPYMFVSISPSDIVYGFGTGPTMLPGSGVTLSWTGSSGDMFTETLTTVKSIDRETSDISSAITVELSGKVSDSDGIFTGSQVLLVLHATQDLSETIPPEVTFTNTSSVAPAIPEASTWAMMALGFGALGYAASRRRKIRIPTLFA